MGIRGLLKRLASLGWFYALSLGVAIGALVVFAKLADEVLKGDVRPLSVWVLGTLHAHTSRPLDTAALGLVRRAQALVPPPPPQSLRVDRPGGGIWFFECPRDDERLRPPRVRPRAGRPEGGVAVVLCRRAAPHRPRHLVEPPPPRGPLVERRGRRGLGAHLLGRLVPVVDAAGRPLSPEPRGRSKVRGG